MAVPGVSSDNAQIHFLPQNPGDNVFLQGLADINGLYEFKLEYTVSVYDVLGNGPYSTDTPVTVYIEYIDNCESGSVNFNP